MSANLLSVHLALRNRALALYVCVTGIQLENGQPLLTESGDFILTEAGLVATTSGYTRSDGGSFITDGFAVGMELTPFGFTSNPVDVIDAVTATTITTHNARTAEGAATGRALYVGFPALFATENVSFTPVSGRPYAEEEFSPSTSEVFSAPARTGEMVEDGIYVLKLYGLSGKGTAALRKSVDALKALFTPGTNLTAGSHTVRMIPSAAATTGQLIPLTSGWTALVLTIPWRVYSNNSTAP